MPNRSSAHLETLINKLCETILDILFEPKLSLISAFIFIIPFFSLTLLVDHLRRTTNETRRVLKLLHEVFVLVLVINCFFNTYYFCAFGIEECQGKMHMVAALCCLLYLIYMSFYYKVTEDVRYGIMIAYLGISLSLFMLPLEYFPPLNKRMNGVFQLGIIIYLFGLIIVFISSKAAGFVRRLRALVRND